MKIINVLIVTCLFIGTNLFSQQGEKNNRKEKYEAIKAERIAFFTQQIGLTPEEAEKFWPLFNEFDDKRDEINKNRRDAIRKLDENNNLTKEEIEKYINIIVSSFKEEALILEEYNNKYKGILPVEKLGKLYTAEHHFRKYLINNLKEKKGGSGGNR